MAKKQNVEQTYDDGTYVVNKKKKFRLLAFLICLVIAFVIWIYVTNVAEERRLNGIEPPPGEEAILNTVVS